MKQLERELHMGIVEPDSMKLSVFLDDVVCRSRRQVRENTIRDYESIMKHFIRIVGDMDFCHVRHDHGERFVQACLDGGNRPATARKKIRTLKRLFQMGVTCLPLPCRLVVLLD